jgi:hypothetical protein
MHEKDDVSAPKPPGRQTGTGSREHARREAVDKNQDGAEQIMQPGPTPPPGVEEDYGKRAGEVPSEEPGNREKLKPAKPT